MNNCRTVVTLVFATASLVAAFAAFPDFPDGRTAACADDSTAQFTDQAGDPNYCEPTCENPTPDPKLFEKGGICERSTSYLGSKYLTFPVNSGTERCACIGYLVGADASPPEYIGLEVYDEDRRTCVTIAEACPAPAGDAGCEFVRDKLTRIEDDVEFMQSYRNQFGKDARWCYQLALGLGQGDICEVRALPIAICLLTHVRAPCCSRSLHLCCR